MHLRSAILGIVACTFAIAPMPVFARDQQHTTGKGAEIAEKLNDPMTQYAIAGMLSAMSNAVLEMPVAPMVEAVEKASGGRARNLPRVRGLAIWPAPIMTSYVSRSSSMCLVRCRRWAHWPQQPRR